MTKIKQRKHKGRNGKKAGEELLPEIKHWRVQLNRTKVMGILFIYVFAANLVLISKIPAINSLELGINLDYWETNAIFFSSVTIWVNLFLYGLLVTWVAHVIVKDRIAKYCTYIIPIYWAFVFIRNLQDVQTEEELLLPDLKYFMYGLLLAALVVLLIRIVAITIVLRAEEDIEDLEQFKKLALKKLTMVNPYLNQQLVKEVVGKHGEAFNLLLAANQEADERKQHMLTRLALIAMDRKKEGNEQKGGKKAEG